LSGRHEPSSSASFWFSLSTAVLRAVLVVAAVVLGVFVLSKAFPTSDEPTPPAAQVTEEPEEEPEETETPDGGGGDGGQQPQQPQSSPQVRGVQVAVLNGTDITGLADCTATERLSPLDYQVAPDDIGNASQSHEVTTISYAREFEADARYLQKELFPDAELQALRGMTAITDVSISLGPDAASGPCGNP
jgi:LytR cell envelope-related transcriptional attenuator